jgi:hypothetical protein
VIQYEKVKLGSQLKVTKLGVGKFARPGDLVTVSGTNWVDYICIINQRGRQVRLELSLGAMRLEPV